MKLSDKWFLVLLLALAVFGQWLMAQAHRGNTLVPALLLYAVAVGLFLWKTGQKDQPNFETKIPAKTEGTLFVLILLLAAFLRVFQLDRIPSGIYIDAAGPAVLSLRMIHESWTPPFMLPKFAANPSFLLYLLEPWLQWFKPTQANLLLFYAVISLAALPLVYWFFRQLAGAPLALLTLFFIAIMRWHIVFSRIGFRGILVPLFMFGTLAFLIYGLRKGKGWALLTAALFLSGGLYFYQSLKAVPLLVLVVLAWEWRKNPEALRRTAKALVAGAVLCLILAWPIAQTWITAGSIGSRESEIFIGKTVLQQKSLKPLADKFTRTVLMFNREGEQQPRHNVQDHRWLDDATGVLFVLGFFLALKRWREKPFFFALGGFAVMSLPGILSGEATQAHRMIGTVPFTAFFAAAALVVLSQKLTAVFPGRTVAVRALLGLLLAAGAVQNAKTYFVDQANDPECWKSFCTDATLVGKAIARHPDTFYYLAPAFYQHYTVQYLAYFDVRRVGKFDWNDMASKPLDGSKPKVCFVLDAGKSPTLELLIGMFPGGTLETEKDKKGEILASFYTLPSGAPKNPLTRGLRREVYGSTSAAGVPALKSLDPLVNFTHLGDFGVTQAPLSAVWNGKIRISPAGSYGFLLLTSDEGGLWLDGKQVLPAGAGGESTVTLPVGWHSLRLTCVRRENPDVSMDFHLLWKKPGQAQWEVVPNGAFGILE